MKKILLLAALSAALPFASALADNLLKNGDFEAGASEEKTYPFYATPGWYNPADAGSKKAMAVNARTTEETIDNSKYSATVNDRQREVSCFSQKTEHGISDGEVFEFTMDWRAGWQWQAQDVVRVKLYATDNNKLGGKVVWEDSFDFENAPVGAWEKATHTFRPASAEATGKTLIFELSGVDPQEAGVAGWARVDNLVLTVKPQ